MDLKGVSLVGRPLRHALALLACLSLMSGVSAVAQTTPPAPPAPSAATPAPATPETKTPPSATPPAPAPTPATPGTTTPPPDAKSQDPSKPTPPTVKTPETKTPETKTPDADVPPEGRPGTTEIEPHGSPGVPQNATTESVNVPTRPVVMVPSRSSYDDAFKSIKASIDRVKAAMDKAGLKPSGHPITIFSEPDDKGFKYKAAIPIAAKPPGKLDLGAEVTIGESPGGKAIKFQHRGAYDDIDSTYDVITAYLDAKGLQVDNPYIEEYLTDLTTPDDPNLQVDIYVFVKP